MSPCRNSEKDSAKTKSWYWREQFRPKPRWTEIDTFSQMRQFQISAKISLFWHLIFCQNLWFCKKKYPLLVHYGLQHNILWSKFQLKTKFCSFRFITSRWHIRSIQTSCWYENKSCVLVQGDTSGWFKPPVDIKSKVLFWPGLAGGPYHEKIQDHWS